MCICVAMMTPWQISCYFVKMISEVFLLCWQSISCNQLENKIKESDWCQKHVELSQAEFYLAEKTRYISFESFSAVIPLRLKTLLLLIYFLLHLP